MRAATPLRLCKLIFASLWAGALIIVGGLFWPAHVVTAVCLIAAGQCVVMWLIADDLWPHALPEVTGFFKLTAAMVFLALLGMVVAVWVG